MYKLCVRDSLKNILWVGVRVMSWCNFFEARHLIVAQRLLLRGFTSRDCWELSRRFTRDTEASRKWKEGRKEMLYLTTHSTHFILGYMASDMW